MLKQITLISIISATLFACSSGSTSARNPVDPSTAYGNLKGAPVAYTGPFLSIYTPSGLQSFITTNTSISSFLGGFSSFGVCNGLESSTIGQDLCTSNKTAINHNPIFSTIFPSGGATVNVDNFVISGTTSLGITSVKPYRILYDTAGAPFQFSGSATNTEIVSAAVLVPQTSSGPLPAAQIKGVLLYYHPTIFSKGGVPSDFNGNLTPNNSPSDIQANAVGSLVEDGMLAAVYASQGYVVVAPDYVGQGADYHVQHPYVIFAQTNAQTGLDALKAARTALAMESVALPNPTKLYISSYSEGGPYALWASKLAQTTYAQTLADNHFTLRRTVGVSGAYDLTGATLHYEFANASNSRDNSLNTWNASPGSEAGPIESASLARAFASLSQAASKTSLAGYVLTSLAYYNSSVAALSILAPEYSAMTNCVDWSLTSNTGIYVTNNVPTDQALVNCPLPYNIAALFNTSGLSQTNIVNQSFASALAATSGVNGFLTGNKRYTDLLLSLASGYTNNSVGTFMSPGILTDQTIIPFIATQNIQSWSTNSPIDILFLNYDSTVTNINGLEACGDIPNFPGYQPNYMGGLKQSSPNGMVTCVNLPNNGEHLLPALYTQSAGLPIFMDHGQAEAVLQILALNQITANP